MGTFIGIVGKTALKYYAHFLVDEPGPRGLQEYRGIVELDGTPRRDRELKEAVMIIARNFESFNMWLIIGVMYFIIIMALTKLSNRLEKRINK